jgi:putative NADPH-quinone reductase
MEKMEHQPLVILGSSRKQSDTLAFVERTMAGIDYHLADLLDYSIAPYHYEHTYSEQDTFMQLVKLLLEHEVIVLATPVYWYSMSGLIKTFFDRLTDLIKVQKPLGRQLNGKKIFLLAAGNNPALPPGFLVPFELTCQYLDMEFKGSLYHSSENPEPTADLERETEAFRRKLLKCF